jgi:hypothetical protein
MDFFKIEHVWAPAGGRVVDRDRPLPLVRIPTTVNSVVIHKPPSPVGSTTTLHSVVIRKTTAPGRQNL